MPFLELTLNIHATRQHVVEETLEEMGALSITLRDADAETPDEQAIFEPTAGECLLWPNVILSALFDFSSDRHQLSARLGNRLAWLEPDQIRFQELADMDWERAWMDQFQPMPFGHRLWISPWNIEPPPDLDHVIVRLDPGLAFGSGTHPTTALCLEWIDCLDLAGKTVIDYGCGSGILGIAALKLGAAKVIGIDNDPQALVASRENARRNGVAHHFALYAAQEHVPEPADVLVANILAAPLNALAPSFAQITRPGACWAISGILAGQETQLQQRYAPWFEHLRVDTREGWVRISGHRRPVTR